MDHIKEIIEYRDMIVSMARRELRGKYEKSVLGFLWSFLNPLAQILISNVIFTRFFHNGMSHFYIYLMTGILPWTFFAESFGQGSGSIIYNAEMVKKIYFPREVLVISEVTAKLVNLLLSFLVMSVFLFLSGVGFSIHIMLLPIAVVIEYLFALGCALLVAAITVYFRDLEYVINVVLMAWIWGTPIMYEANGVLDPLFRTVLYANPMTRIIECYHKILYYHSFPSMSDWLIPFAEGAAILVIGYMVFNRLNRRFVEEL